jgi:hypothetical protein
VFAQLYQKLRSEEVMISQIIIAYIKTSVSLKTPAAFLKHSVQYLQDTPFFCLDLDLFW